MTKTQSYPTFTISGKEHELKLDFAGIDYLNKATEGGAISVVGKTFTGELDHYVNLVFASLKHTGENYTHKQVQAAIQEQFEKEELDLNKIMKDSNAVISNCFFYKKTLKNVMKDEEASQAIQDLIS